MEEPRRLTLTVTAEQDGWKVDTLLRRGLGLSGTVIRRIKWLEDGILLDGTRVTTGHRAAVGQVLSVRVADPDHKGLMLPTPGPLAIVLPMAMGDVMGIYIAEPIADALASATTLTLFIRKRKTLLPLSPQEAAQKQKK